MSGSSQPLERLTVEHDCSAFRSGADELDLWLRTRALQGNEVGNAATFVFTERGQAFGYYALATGGIEHAAAPEPVRRNAPRPIPALLLARLAVDERAQGRGLGQLLLRDALLRSARVSENVGFRALLVHSRDEAARRFYLHHVPAFIPSPTDELHLLLPLTRLRDALS